MSTPICCCDVIRQQFFFFFCYLHLPLCEVEALSSQVKFVDVDWLYIYRSEVEDEKRVKTNQYGGLNLYK